MNSDQAYDQLQNQQYTYAKNIRITKNQLVGDADEDYSTLHEGIISPVHKGFVLEDATHNLQFPQEFTILATATVDDMGIIVGKYDSRLQIYRFKIQSVGDKDKIVDFVDWLSTDIHSEINDIKQVSVVLYKELDNVIKAYIATGIWPILTVRMDDAHVYGQNINIDTLINNRVMPTEPVFIQDIISGQLKTSQVQYTYRYYNKYGITTRLAPLTNKIQVIDSNRNKEIGNAEDTATTIGFALKINYTNDDFERMQIYRVQYIKENEDAQVYLIYDGDKQSTFNDVGIDPLQTLTMEEFSALSGVQVIPEVIEHNQDYMFASNVKDDTIIKGIDIDREENYISNVYTEITLAKGNSLQFLPTRDGEQINDNYKINLWQQPTTPITLEDYVWDRNINPTLVKDTYNNIFTSSLLRSLRRGETYKYGIIYYDKYGRRSDVISIDDITIPEIIPNTPGGELFGLETINQNGEVSYKITATVYGVRIKLPQPNVPDIIGCQIVRRSSKDIYQKSLLQVALARPIRQKLYKTSEDINPLNSPYYPTGFLTSDHFCTNGYYGWRDISAIPFGPKEGLRNVNQGNQEVFTNTYGTFTKESSANSFDNVGLFQIFSSEIDFRRDDTLSKILQNDVFLHPVQILTPIECTTNNNNFIELTKSTQTQLREENPQTPSNAENTYYKTLYNNYTVIDINNYDGTEDHPLYIPKRELNGEYVQTPRTLNQVNKSKDHLLFDYVPKDMISGTNIQIPILSVTDVKIPKWHEGFSNIQYSGAQIVGGIKQYESYESNTDEYTYNNWVSAGLYDLQIYDENQPNTYTETKDSYSAAQFLYDTDPAQRNYPDYFNDEDYEDTLAFYPTFAKGFIGPGPSCLLIALDKNNQDIEETISGYPLGTVICNIEHKIEYQNAEPDEFVQYFGFGNYFQLEYNNLKNEYKVVHNNGWSDNYMYVFDGDVYITPHEITTQYKAYDFNSKDTLPSMQITNYVPLESKVNTFFDYGMNYLNTQSSNLLYDSGSIEGITSQNRPAHQYNMIYSNNDVSNDVFSLISTDENETNLFPHRTYYSEPKINGEFIDNFTIFKAVSFIDVDSKYGQLTNLLTDKNALYYWQEHAFGKFSVNERSLINDQNGNTIMLGQAGILSRYDYINTKYGMRDHDFSAISAEDKVYWIDINNRAIVVGNTSGAANLGEQLNVQNIINAKIDTERIPKIDYDLQNNELLCKCLTSGDLTSGEQLIFNIKYNIATSIYNRIYDDIVYIKNHIYGIQKDYHRFVKFNYLHNDDVTSLQANEMFLRPMQLSFIVNPATSVTKVFDSQTMIPIKRDTLNETFFNGIKTEFETDILNTNKNTIEPHTDREGNIIYNIPRFGSEDYGNRMRGKWMRCYFEQDPHEFFTISHVITKFRQSYS